MLSLLVREILAVVAVMTLVAVVGIAIGKEGDAARPTTVEGANLLVNPGFEENRGEGTVPTGWNYIDEYLDYFEWIAPRAARRIGTIPPRTGQFMAGLDLDMLGVDTKDRMFHVPRAALYQTVRVPGRCRGTFSLYFNDLESSALCHISAIRLAYTVGETRMSEIRFPAEFSRELTRENTEAGAWSKPYYRVSQKLPLTVKAVGDWTLARIPVKVETDLDEADLTLWIGIFEHQGSTEVGYYRIDDASFVLDAEP